MQCVKDIFSDTYLNASYCQISPYCYGPAPEILILIKHCRATKSGVLFGGFSEYTCMLSSDELYGV